MANEIWRIDLLATGSNYVTKVDDGTGIDWMEIRGSYSFATDIRLHETNSVGLYYLPGGVTNTLDVTGVIENVRGSDSDDYVVGNSLGNVLFGDFSRISIGGNDNLNGADGNDTEYGGLGLDSLYGGSGDDKLYGDAGADFLGGDAGNDTMEGGTGADTLQGGDGINDTIAYSASGAAVHIDITYGITTTGHGGHAEGDQISSTPDVIGSNFNDLITDTKKGQIAFGYNDNDFFGGGGDDKLVLGGGNDRGYGGIGNDSILGEANNDSLLGGDGKDSLFGGDGADRLNGGNGDDQVSGDVGSDFLTGDAGNDILYGGVNSDQLFGGDGNDRLFGGAGLDHLTGGGGTDQFVFTTASETTAAVATCDVIMDFQHAQLDRINLQAIDADPGTAGNQTFVWRGALGFNGVHGALTVVNQGANTLVQGDVNGDHVADFSILVMNTVNMVQGDFVL